MSALGTSTAADLRAEVQEGTKRVRVRIRETLEDWFHVCDHILDIHRTRFLVREPSADELEEHRVAVGECIETCRLMAAQLTDRSADERDFLSRLNIRTRQLQDAYDTFHDRTFSDRDAE